MIKKIFIAYAILFSCSLLANDQAIEMCEEKYSICVEKCDSVDDETKQSQCYENCDNTYTQCLESAQSQE